MEKEFKKEIEALEKSTYILALSLVLASLIIAASVFYTGGIISANIQKLNFSVAQVNVPTNNQTSEHLQFDQCLDNGTKSQIVQRDMNYGTQLGVSGTPTFFINGKEIVGAQPYDTFKQEIEAALAEGTSNNISITDSPSKGLDSATVVIVEFSDFQCPYCGSAATGAVAQIMKDYVDTGKVKLVFKNFPLSFHQYAEKAAEAAECARDQGKFWEMHDKLFSNQNALTVNDLKGYAGELGLN